MTATILCLLFFVWPVRSIGWTMYRDAVPKLDKRSELERLTAPLPEVRESLLPVDWRDTWPQRQTPSDLPARHATAELEAYPLAPRVRTATVLAVAEITEGRHHIGVAPGTELQRQRWNSPTGQFWIIVGDIADLDQPCAHCAAPEDGEPAHAGCPGCSCPCSLVVPIGA
jgi:hypothetical protein